MDSVWGGLDALVTYSFIALGSYAAGKFLVSPMLYQSQALVKLII